MSLLRVIVIFSGNLYHFHKYAVFIFIFLFPAIHVRAQETKKIDITSNYIEFDSKLGNGAKRLLGNVKFKHEEVYMTCDSAYYYAEENIVDAFSNVHAWQGDTLDLYGDFLKYNGNSEIANIRKNVLLIDKETRLTTDYIDHNFAADFSYFINGGEIVNGDNNVKSEIGYYYSEEKLFYFKDSVVVINPDYIIYTDTLKYNTQTEIAYFQGATDIISEENKIYCENGWYDTKKEISQFNRNALFETGGTSIRGDSLYYERETGLGKAFINVVLIDSAQNMIMKGNRVIYYEDPEYAMVTDRAEMIQIDNQDSLFVHADTIFAIPDTLEDMKIVKAFYHVKFFRPDFQGKCDSLTYSEIDSVFRFYGEPVLWSEENQLTAEFIELHTKNREIDRIEMIRSAFIISIEDSLKFNQIKGRDMTGFIFKNKIESVNVKGNSETIYYGKDQEEIVGVNKAISSNLKIQFKENKPQKITYLTSPTGTYYPLELLSPAESRLENFKWYDDYRPKKKEDIFIWKRGSPVPPSEESSSLKKKSSLLG